MPHFYTKALFTVFFILWAVLFYLKKVSLKNELVTDGVWWIPYFLVIGLGILALSQEHTVILTVRNWGNLVQFAFLFVICAILFFWEWPPWFFRSKVLISKGKRILLASLFFIIGLVFWVYGGVCLLNTALDHSKPMAHDCYVMDKAILGQKNKEDTQYIIFIQPWRTHLQSRSFFVSSQDFQHIKADSTVVRIWTKEGFFHFEWVTGMKILTL